MLTRIYAAQTTMKEACDKLGRQVNIMEVCGTHTVSIFRNGIRPTLHPKLNLLSGPGCPVCVTDQGYIDSLLTLADREDVIIATYGDMIRVPGCNGSLEQKTMNKNIEVVLSTQDALQLAKDNPNKTVVFAAVGFETTTPATAVAVLEAADQNLTNFTVFSAHKLVIPAMNALLAEKNDKIDAFLCPGHVSVIIGYAAYNEIVEKFDRPCVVAGFEPMQIIEGLAAICKMLIDEKPQTSSIYHAAVTAQGNQKARQIVDKVFTTSDSVWRGLGEIKKSGLKLKDEYNDFDAVKRFGLTEKSETEVTGCRCGEVLCGLISPNDCGMFGQNCTPESPVGPCMVSSEGACAAWFKYGRRRKK